MKVANPSWNLTALRTYIKTSYAGDAELQQLVRSIERSCRIFGYHMVSARDAMKAWIPEDAEDAQTEMMLAVFGSLDQQPEYEWAKIVNEAHLIACLHTTRGVWDIYAQLLNRLIVTTPLSVERCDIGRVVALLPASALRDRLNRLLASYWYRYVSAFINTTKHRQLVEHMTTVSFADGRSGIRIGKFQYQGSSFPDYWDTEVLVGVIEVKNAVIDCGRSLNAHLGI